MQMNWVFISILILSIAEGWLCGLPSALSILAGLLFILRFKGIVCPSKICFGLEVATAVFLALIILFNIKIYIPQLFLFTGLKSLIYWIDDKFFVYVTEDYNESNED